MQFSVVAAPIYIPTSSVGEGSFFSTPSPATTTARFFCFFLFFKIVVIFYFLNLFIYLFIFGCVGSSFLCEGFL